ncbi:MAG TPA: peptidylprolyl isomerase [Herpetosiphonaceae bacterium]
MLLRRLWLAVAAIALLAGCASTRPPINAMNPTAGPEDAVARITFRDNSVVYISQATLDQFRNQVYASQQGPAPAEPVLNELITRQLLLRLARNTDVVADPQNVDRTFTNVRDRLCAERVEGQVDAGDPNAVWDVCAQTFGFPDGAAFRNFISEELTIDQVARKEAPKDMIRAAHILFDAADYIKAAETYQRLQRSGGGDFTDLAKELSVEPAAKQSGGELPAFNEQGITEEGQPFDTIFVSKTYELKPKFLETGQAISEPFETQFGWHIVKVLELTASQQASQGFRDAILERARDAQVADLQQPDSGEIPLLGVAEILKPLPSPEVVPTIEPVPVPEESPTPEATSSVPEEATPAPDETTTATP